MFEQLTLFDFTGREEPNKQEEVVLYKLKYGEYHNNYVVSKGGYLWWKQELKKKWPEGSTYEEFNKPSYYMLCKECFKEGMLTDGEEVKDGLCYMHR